MITKTFIPKSGVKPFMIMETIKRAGPQQTEGAKGPAALGLGMAR
jgi:hypothetical protein